MSPGDVTGTHNALALGFISTLAVSCCDSSEVTDIFHQIEPKLRSSNLPICFLTWIECGSRAKVLLLPRQCCSIAGNVYRVIPRRSQSKTTVLSAPFFFFIALPQTGFGNSSDTTGPTSGQPLTHTRLKVTSSTNHRCSNLIGWLTNFCLSYFTSRGLFCQKASYSLFHGCIQRTGYQGSNTGLH